MFSVNATNVDDPTNIRYLNVLSNDDTAKTVTVLFGGAWSGNYQVAIRHSVYGLLETTNLILKVGTQVDAISRNTIGMHGGTLFTITGKNFGKEKTDNPVQISYNGGLGSSNCFVQTISETEIVCRVESFFDRKIGSFEFMPEGRPSGTQAKLVVFLKASEEADCDYTNTCVVTLTDTLPSLTSVTASYDSASTSHQLTVSGTDFTGDTSSTYIEIGGVRQETVSVTTTSAVFKITDVTSSTIAKNLMVYFPEGHPKNHPSATSATITIDPKLESITPNSGTTAGTLIRASVPGLTVTDSQV
jgi:hypothetical protein